MAQKTPLHLIWWLVSRASGIVALVLISLSVLMGLAMAARAIRRPAIKRAVARLHEHIALISILAIAIHGVALLGDQWLKPGWSGITIPFALSYRPAFTGLGIIAGYLTILLGPSFYLRRRIGARRWRTLHRGTIVIWVLAVVHTLGAGSDRSKLWMQWIVVAPVVPIVYLLVLRLLPGDARRRGTPPRRPGLAPHAGRSHHVAAPRTAVAGRHLPPERAQHGADRAIVDPITE